MWNTRIHVKHRYTPQLQAHCGPSCTGLQTLLLWDKAVQERLHGLGGGLPHICLLMRSRPSRRFRPLWTGPPCGIHIHMPSTFTCTAECFKVPGKPRTSQLAPAHTHLRQEPCRKSLGLSNPLPSRQHGISQSRHHTAVRIHSGTRRAHPQPHP